MKISIAFGARSHAYNLARSLDRQGFLHRLYTFYPSYFLHKELRKRCSSFPYLHMGLTAMSRMRMGGLARRWNPAANEIFDKWVARVMEPADIFMTLSGLGLHARRAAKQLGALSVCDRGGSHIRYQDELLAEEFSRWGIQYEPIHPGVVATEEMEYAESDLVVLQSSFAYNSFLKCGVSPEKLTWLSLAVDLDTFFPEPKLDDVFRILYIGQISLRKGIQYLLEAAVSVADSNTEVVLAGAILPEANSFLRRYEGRFRYAGRPGSKEELRHLYAQASVFAFPSIEDGFGLVLNEAMACGLPIVASTHTGAPDLIEDGQEGFLIPIRSAKALSERLIYLRDNPTIRHEMAIKALAAAQRRSWDAYSQNVLNLYTNTLAMRKAMLSK